MAIGIAVFGVLFVCFLGPASATYCSDDTDCYGFESCCSDYECRETCSSITGATIAGIIVSVVFVALVFSLVACYYCAWCPYYRYRHPGVVVVGAPRNQLLISTTSTQATQQPIQHPPPAGYFPPSGYNQPPPPYYPQPQAGQLPPSQAQGQAAYPPPQPLPPPQAQAHPQFPVHFNN